MHLSPAEYVIKVFGGVRATARAIGRAPSSVCKWRAPVENAGTGGLIPSAVQRTILDKAEELKLDITDRDLVRGRNLKKRR